MNKISIKNLTILSFITCVICACSPKEEECDMTGVKYSEMLVKGNPLSEKDKACYQALVIKGFSDLAKESNVKLEKLLADEKERKKK